MSEVELLVRAGACVDATGERVADVRVVDGVIAEVGAGAARRRGRDRARRRGLRRRARPRRHPGALPRAGPRGQPRRSRPGPRAAALGGCTAVVCMPNTEPPLDDAAVVQSVLERGRGRGCATCASAGCITKGRQGEELAPMGELYDLGVRVFTDDGDCVADALRDAAARSSTLGALPGAVLAQHAEDPALVRGGHMHEGAWSARLGIPGRPGRGGVVDRRARPRSSRSCTGGRYHVLHMSSAAVGRARARGQGRRRARHRRVHAAAPRAHRRGVRGLRPGRSR